MKRLTSVGWYSSTIALAIVLATLLGCSRRNTSHIPIGTIVTSWNEDVKLLHFHDGSVELREVPQGWLAPDARCAISDSEVIVSSQNDFLGSSIPYPQMGSSDHLALVSSTSKSIKIHPISTGHKMWVKSLDFDDVTNRYLLCGRLDSMRGVFLLTSNWDLKEKLFDSLPEDSRPSAAWFIRDGRVAIVSSFRTTIIDLSNRLQLSIVEGRCVGVARKHEMVIWNGQTGSFWVRDISSDSSQELKFARDPACVPVFSPDGEYIAYRKISGITDLSELYLYEVSKKRSVKTDFTDVSSMLWLPR